MEGQLFASAREAERAAFLFATEGAIKRSAPAIAAR
jgi:hypothetical protein